MTKMIGNMRIVLVVCMVIVLGAAADLLAFDTSSLNGTYKSVGQDAGFWQGQSGGASAIMGGSDGTMTFDGAGNCSYDFSDTTFSLAFSPDATVSTQPQQNSGVCTYSVAGDGTVTVTHANGTETLWLDVSGTRLVSGGAQTLMENLEIGREISQTVAVKVGSPSLAGTYHLELQNSGFQQSNQNMNAAIKNNSVTFVADGNGGCTVAYREKEFGVSLFSSSPSIKEKSSSAAATQCSYTTGANGLVTVHLPDNSFQPFQLSSDGMLLMAADTTTETFGNETVYEVMQALGVKAGSGMKTPSLQGTFRVVGQDPGFWQDAGGVSVNLSGYHVLAKFNGAGKCSYVNELGFFSVPIGVLSPTITADNLIESGDCSYTVSSTGLVKLSTANGSEYFWLSADGNTLLSGGAQIVPDGTGTGYESRQAFGVKVDPYIGSVDSPSNLLVPLNEAVGKYVVSWTPSATADVAYVLEESTDPAFPETTASRIAYRGTATSANIGGRKKGERYYYRIYATKAGYAPSSLVAGANPCHVASPLPPARLVVPATDVDGSYAVSWMPSKSTDVTYALEESTTADFTTGIQEVYRGADTSVALSGRAAATTYYYRVKSVKTGFPDSPWKTMAKGCKVAPKPPADITVPVADADGSYAVSWGASPTVGVSYLLMEATNNTFTQGVRKIKAGTATSASISGRSAGKTYYYRVQATLAGFVPSDWTTAVNGCPVGN